MKRYGRFAGLTLLWFCSLWMYRMEGGYAAAFLCYFLGTVLVYVLSVPLLCLRSVKVFRSVDRSEAMAGETVAVTLEVVQRSLLPLPWLAVKDGWGGAETAASDAREAEKAALVYARLSFPGWSSRIRYRYTMADMGRGVYRARPVELTAGDLFGFWTLRRTCMLTDTVTVFPRPEPVVLPALRIGPGMEEESTQERARTVHPTAGVGASIRQYAAGDPLRFVHWKATAKTGQLMTREPVPFSVSRFLIVADASAASYEGDPQMFEKTVRLAAGLQTALASRGGQGEFASSAEGAGTRERVSGLAASNSREIAGVRQSVGGMGADQGLREFYRLLAGLRPEGSRAFADYVSERVAHSPKERLLCMVTPNVEERLLQAISLLQMQRRPLLIVWLAADSGRYGWQADKQRRLEAMGCRVLVWPCEQDGSEVTARVLDADAG